VEPVVGELLAGRALALRDLVLVVREDEVNAPGVDVEGLAEVLHGHRGALDVPAGTPATDLGVPSGLVPGFGGLPEGEVARVLLLVLVRVHALAAADDVALEVGLRELAVFGERLDAVVVRAAGAVGVPLRFEPLDDLDHLRDVSRRARHDVGALAPQGVEVFPERLDVARRVVVNREAALLRVLDDAVFHVRDVHHVHDFVAAVFEVAGERVAEDAERAEVADVREVPDGRAAEVNPRPALPQRSELF
jgi:hypothetical protein